jgi:hypothetical protein
MIVAHIVMNIFFVSFFALDVLKIRKNQSGKKMAGFIVPLLVLGILAYISYVILMLSRFTVDGFDKRTFPLLMLSWACMNSVYVFLEKKVKI